MGLLDKLLGRDPKPTADQNATAAAVAAAANDEAFAQRDDETSPHHKAEQAADS
jgi:hypothetical protein